MDRILRLYRKEQNAAEILDSVKILDGIIIRIPTYSPVRLVYFDHLQLFSFLQRQC